MEERQSSGQEERLTPGSMALRVQEAKEFLPQQPEECQTQDEEIIFCPTGCGFRVPKSHIEILDNHLESRHGIRIGGDIPGR